MNEMMIEAQEMIKQGWVVRVITAVKRLLFEWSGFAQNCELQSW